MTGYSPRMTRMLDAVDLHADGLDLGRGGGFGVVAAGDASGQDGSGGTQASEMVPLATRSQPKSGVMSNRSDKDPPRNTGMPTVATASAVTRNRTVPVICPVRLVGPGQLASSTRR
jgi:hypothetical protein